MALTRRSAQRVSNSIWPGFVDAMTALLLVIMFVLTIFMIVQFMLRETISGQETELDALAGEVTALAQALGLEQQRTFQLEGQIGTLGATLDRARSDAVQQTALIASLRLQTATQTDQLATLSDQFAAQKARITSFESQVASLLSQRDAARSQGAALAANLADLESDQARMISEQEALQIALAGARDELDAQVETARLAAARREALSALVVDLQTKVSERDASLVDVLAQLQNSQGQSKDLEDRLAISQRDLKTENEALLAALAAADAVSGQLSQAQAELSDQEAARLAEASAAAALRARLENSQGALSDAEATRLAEAAAAELLRERLKSANDELTAMTLALEDRRKAAEDTLTLLAAANAVEKDLDSQLVAALLSMGELKTQITTTENALTSAGASNLDLDAQLKTAVEDRDGLQAQLAETENALALIQSEVSTLRGGAGDDDILRAKLMAALAAQVVAEGQAQAQLSLTEQRDVLLATANDALAKETAQSAEGLRKLALLNEQVAELRGQLGSLQALLDVAAEKDLNSKTELTNLGSQLNAALAQLASEERRRADLETAARTRVEQDTIRQLAQEEAERKRLEAEAKQLERYRSEFFGQLREVLGDREGIEIVGDRFVFSSEVLFQPASADLASEGRDQIERVAAILEDVADAIPPEIDWIIRVDGHTDATLLAGTGRYRDNWELSQARALAVVRYMTNDLGFAPERLAATGFGEFRPVAEGDSPEALARNRRIELKLTER
ncbi:MAG: peptidoglycan -binding protein [Marinosulfonomonas sp.]|nr:peptidoglycan -binding protein [Marinosulfonomonas sp.]